MAKRTRRATAARKAVRPRARRRPLGAVAAPHVKRVLHLPEPSEFRRAPSPEPGEPG